MPSLSRALILACAILPISSTLEPQAAPPQPAAPRAIALPDTLGASFDIGDSAKAVATPTDFDFLVGVWEFKFQQRRPTGDFSPPFQGLWQVEKKDTPNAFIQDHFRPNRRLKQESGTWTYRVFSPQRKLWMMQGVESESGSWAPGLCWSDARNRYVIQHYGSNIMRIRYFDISDDAFLWRADLSRDNGQTWVRDWWTMEAKRIAR